MLPSRGTWTPRAGRITSVADAAAMGRAIPTNIQIARRRSPGETLREKKRVHCTRTMFT
jgi:hypothetical protein